MSIFKTRVDDDDTALVEAVAVAIYCDSYTQYGTCSPERWRRTSEGQREFCRDQARAAIAAARAHVQI